MVVVALGLPLDLRREVVPTSTRTSIFRQFSKLGSRLGSLFRRVPYYLGDLKGGP